VIIYLILYCDITHSEICLGSQVDSALVAIVIFLASFHEPSVVFEQLSLIYSLPRYLVRSFRLILPFFPTGTMERIDTEGQVRSGWVWSCDGWEFVLRSIAMIRTQWGQKMNQGILGNVSSGVSDKFFKYKFVTDHPTCSLSSCIQVVTAKCMASLLSIIPFAARGPAQIFIFDIHALQERFYFSDQVIPRLLRRAR